MSPPLAPVGRTFSPEQELLLCCCRPSLDSSHRARISELLANGVAWDELDRAGVRHRVTPQLHHHLGAAARGACPAPILDRWRAASLGFHLLNRRLYSELGEIQAVFGRSGIPLAAFKGPVAAWLLYGGNLGLRSITDLDLLVPDTFVREACDLLRRRGYTTALSLSPSWDAVLFRKYNELCFWRPQPSTTVDLHWRLTLPGHSFSRIFDGLWNNLETVQVDRFQVATLGAEDLLLYSCMHGAKHDWTSLHNLCDLAELIRRRSDLDWDRIGGRAAANGARGMVDLGLRLAHDLLGAPVPAEVLRSAAARPDFETLVGRAIGQLLPASASDEATSIWPWKSIYFAALETRRDRLRHVYDILLAPCPLEWQLLPLPTFLAPAYHLVRPLRLLARHLRFRPRRKDRTEPTAAQP